MDFTGVLTHIDVSLASAQVDDLKIGPNILRNLLIRPRHLVFLDLSDEIVLTFNVVVELSIVDIAIRRKVLTHGSVKHHVIWL